MLQVNYETKPVFAMVVGLPGSGKSTYIKKYFENYTVHSSDTIREELSGDVNNQDINKQVFDLLHKRIKEDLIKGKDTIYDATNISWKRRKAFLTELNSIPCYKCCYLIATPYEICLERNKARDRVVPHNVIERMYRNFDIPWYNEGWDNIFICYTEPYFEEYYGRWGQFTVDYLDFPQESKWHTQTLGEHCESTYNYIRSRDKELNSCTELETKIAAALHDCGKPFCKTFRDSKGEPSEFAHYYSHENVGSYNSLFYDKEDTVDDLLVAALIRYHMILHFFKDWKHKTIDKYEKEFTEHKWLKEINFYGALKILHEGDKNSH
jgi:predicted kinase